MHSSRPKFRQRFVAERDAFDAVGAEVLDLRTVLHRHRHTVATLGYRTYRASGAGYGTGVASSVAGSTDAAPRGPDTIHLMALAVCGHGDHIPKRDAFESDVGNGVPSNPTRSEVTAKYQTVWRDPHLATSQHERDAAEEQQANLTPIADQQHDPKAVDRQERRHDEVGPAHRAKGRLGTPAHRSIMMLLGTSSHLFAR
jgi:hypothetical protein